jgi:hypothetical protein
MFTSGSQDNLIIVDMVSKLGLEVRNHPRHYPLGLVKNDAKLKVRKKCKIKFTLSA